MKRLNKLSFGASFEELFKSEIFVLFATSLVYLVST